MDVKIRKQLEEARAKFFSWRLAEAYSILRRFYDRLPFCLETEHAEYIGIFVRTLAELGRDNELTFYVPELEKWYEKLGTPSLAYPLAVLYLGLPQPRRELARQLLQKLISDPAAVEYHAKAKMMLADYYTYKGDTLACRQTIDSITEPSDPHLASLLEIWRANVARREKKYGEAIERLATLFTRITIETDWYAFVSAKIILAMAYLETGARDKAEGVVQDVRRLCEGRPFRSIQNQLKALEVALRSKIKVDRIRLGTTRDDVVIAFDNRRVSFARGTPSERLMSLLAKQGFVDKPAIVKALYERPYSGESDDKLIYYHIHSLRKRLTQIGLPGEAITNEEAGYRLLPDVDLVLNRSER